MRVANRWREQIDDEQVHTAAEEFLSFAEKRLEPVGVVLVPRRQDFDYRD
jgi:hypothetical protein